ncbi:MAG: hypothetical protein ABIJ59_16955 [Pseudomonadota bacterium]
MKLKTGIEKTISPSETIVSGDKSKIPQKPAVAISSTTQSGFKKDTKQDQVANAFLSNEIKKPDIKTLNDNAKVSKVIPKFTIVKKELNTNEKFLLTFDRSKLYIWKTNEGVIGFSDIQYPEKKDLTIYKDKSWIKYQDNQNSSEPE